MTYPIDFSIATSDQIEFALCNKLENIRLARNMTQEELANDAGVSLRTMVRLENGKGVSLDTFIRVLIALGIQQNLETLLPDPSIRPIDRVNLKGNERKRASSKSTELEKKPWSWGDETEGDLND
ncbi:MAG TPA: transcriptional regulator [Clostridiales bacterium]|jgi:transcriptional regulator with XRE-family HTH domain|nr:transcriptional regulator [Clostridiales bacterium]